MPTVTNSLQYVHEWITQLRNGGNKGIQMSRNKCSNTYLFADDLSNNVRFRGWIFFKKALTVLCRPLAYPNGLLDLHIEALGRTPWPEDQPDARPLLTQDNTTQKHADTRPCPKQDLNLWSQCSSGRRQYLP
jgi:hypothetical protein